MRLKNGKNECWQWDRHQILVFDDYPPQTEVHLFGTIYEREGAIVMHIDQNGELEIPDILLRQAGTLYVYIVCSNEFGTSFTDERLRIHVEPRPRPDDYVYTPEETKLWEQKLDKKFGVENAGKFLAIANDGTVIPEDVQCVAEYKGTYTTVSKFGDDVVLETKDKAMTDNVTVKKMPQFEVSNDAGGKTLILGDEYYGK